jgi:uncharacterized repeat protein (TIGR01451 family)
MAKHLSFFTKTSIGFTRVFLVAALCIWMSVMQGAMAQSACTALWGAIDNDGVIGGAGSLRYFNSSTNRWTNLSPPITLAGNANALAGDPGTGLLYYVNRDTGDIHSFNLNTQVDTNFGQMTAPPVATRSNILGATIPSPGILILYLTENGGLNREYIGRINLTAPTVATWTQVLTIGGANPPLGNSGDLFTDQQGRTFISSNTGTNTFWILNVDNPADVANYARTTQTLTLNSTLAVLAGSAVNPVGGGVVIGTVAEGTYGVNTTTGVVTLLEPPQIYGVSDLGNCVAPPLAPSVVKSFSPTYRPLGAGTSTLSIRINNANTVPIWLFSNFVDTLPAGMVIATPNGLNAGGCASIGTTVTNTITANSGEGTVTFSSGGRIPAGGCTVTLTVTAPANGAAYVNDIPAGALQTTAGNNAATTTASLKVGTDFSTNKQQATTGALQTSTLSTLAGQTITYVLTFVNSSVGGTGSATISDTLPSAITPVLALNAAHSGGGSCAAVTATVGLSTQINGTITNALAASTCTVTVTGLISGVASLTTLTNAVNVAPTVGTSDTSATNNQSTVTATVTPAAALAATKTSGTTQTVAGATVAYTVTFSNLGPSPANNATIQDTASAGLSNCSVISCTGAGTPTPATCPATPAASLAPSSTTIPSFPANSSVTLVVQCGVTVTGL